MTIKKIQLPARTKDIYDRSHLDFSVTVDGGDVYNVYSLARLISKGDTLPKSIGNSLNAKNIEDIFGMQLSYAEAVSRLRELGAYLACGASITELKGDTSRFEKYRDELLSNLDNILLVKKFDTIDISLIVTYKYVYYLPNCLFDGELYAYYKTHLECQRFMTQEGLMHSLLSLTEIAKRRGITAKRKRDTVLSNPKYSHRIQGLVDPGEILSTKVSYRHKPKQLFDVTVEMSQNTTVLDCKRNIKKINAAVGKCAKEFLVQWETSVKDYVCFERVVMKSSVVYRFKLKEVK